MSKYKNLSTLYFEQYGEYPNYSAYYNEPLWKLYQVDYKQVSTRDLLMLLRSWNVTHSKMLPDEFEYILYNTQTQKDMRKFEKIKKAIKRELATREHIPNKAEAKKIRQEKAKNKR